MLLIFRKRFVSPRIFTKKKTFEKKNLELPGALQAPSRPLRPANRSLVFTGRGASPKKFGPFDFFLEGTENSNIRLGFLERKGQCEFGIFS